MTRLLIFGFIAAFFLLALQITVATKVVWIVVYYQWIFWLNIFIIALLAIATLYKVWQLFYEVRRQKYGSRLALRLFTVLSLASVIPSLVVYGLSYRFLDSSIESWFKLEIDQTVSGGINLAKWVTDEEAKRLEVSANALALTLGDELEKERQKTIGKWREILGVESITLFDEDRNLLAHNHKNLISLSAELPDALLLKDISFRASAQILNKHQTNINSKIKNSVHNLDNAETFQKYIRVLVRVPVSQNTYLTPSEFSNDVSINPLTNGLKFSTNKALYIQITQTVPERISEGLYNLSAAYTRYGELQQGRDGLKKLFLTSLSLLFALALILALSLAFYFSSRFIRPLGILTEGTRAVARGDFSRKLLEGGREHDEFDQLIMSFNDMTDELFSAQANAENSRRAMEDSEKFLQNVLDHLNAGVLIVDTQVPDKTLSKKTIVKALMVNNSGVKLLGKQLLEEFNKPLNNWEAYKVFANCIFENINNIIDQRQINLFAEETVQNKNEKIDFSKVQQNTIATEWNQQVDIRLTQGYLTFMLRAVQIPNDSRWVVVFDDITELLRAKHMQVWSELARRLAHEIKNPLTPIQLSAERLLVKLSEKVPETDREFLERSTGTIVSQVDAIKTLVNQFREMARPASSFLEVFTINDLLAEVATLYDEKRVKFIKPRKKYNINADRHQLRQVFHNLILNAEQANFEKFQDWDKSRVLITLFEQAKKTSENNDLIELADGREEIVIEVCDIGGGFNNSIIDRAFEPNVTTKIKGSGLGLSIVRKIVEEHRGIIAISNRQWIAGSSGFEWDNISPANSVVCGAVITIKLPIYIKENSE